MGRVLSSIASTASASGAKATDANGPGSNGYWRRDIYRLPGTYTWTAAKDGNIKIQGLGAGSGGSGAYPGSSAGFGEKTLAVTAGQTLTIVVGLGGLGGPGTTTSTAGGSTSISGTPVGATPLVLTGAVGSYQNGASFGTPGATTGPWDRSFSGAKATAINQGSPSSGSPFGAGFASSSSGGSGWGGSASSSGGASSHHAGSNLSGADGFLAMGGRRGATTGAPGEPGDRRPFWDLRDIDGGGGGWGFSASEAAGSGGPGAGGGGNSASPGSSVIGGGTGFSTLTAPGVKSGHGAGGCATNGSNLTGGDGGNGWIAVFWDEVI